MPVLSKAQEERGDVTFVFVNQGESESEIRDYLRESHLQLSNVLLDPFSSVMQESGSRGLPTTLFFDADGRLVDTHMGELSNASLAVKLRSEEHTSELQSLMRISYAVFRLKKKKTTTHDIQSRHRKTTTAAL